MMTSLVFLQQGNVKKSKTLIKIVNIENENLHIFWTTWGISMKFSGKTWLMIILKVTKKQGLCLCLSVCLPVCLSLSPSLSLCLSLFHRHTFWEKPQWGRTSAWCKDLSLLFHKTIMDISWKTFLKRMHIHIII